MSGVANKSAVSSVSVVKCSSFLNDISINAVLGELEPTHNHYNVSLGQSLFRDIYLGSKNDRELMLLLWKCNK